jgi:hypothetical protein
VCTAHSTARPLPLTVAQVLPGSEKERERAGRRDRDARGGGGGGGGGGGDEDERGGGDDRRGGGYAGPGLNKDTTAGWGLTYGTEVWGQAAGGEAKGEGGNGKAQGRCRAHA